MDAQPGSDEVVKLTEKVGDFLRPHFPSTTDPAVATSMLTTAEFHAMLEEHAPEMVPLSMFRDVLVALDYHEHLVGGELRWLIRRP
jgi:hypothetical protein